MHNYILLLSNVKYLPSFFLSRVLKLQFYYIFIFRILKISEFIYIIFISRYLYIYNILRFLIKCQLVTFSENITEKPKYMYFHK